jgi:hypothetical protein
MSAEAAQQLHGPVAVLHTGGRDHHGHEQPSRVAKHGALAAVAVWVGLVSVAPYFSLVLTECRLMRPALSCRGLPAATRPSPRSLSGLCCQLPSSRHARTYG